MRLVRTGVRYWGNNHLRRLVPFGEECSCNLSNIPLYSASAAPEIPTCIPNRCSFSVVLNIAELDSEPFSGCKSTPYLEWPLVRGWANNPRLVSASERCSVHPLNSLATHFVQRCSTSSFVRLFPCWRRPANRGRFCPFPWTQRDPRAVPSLTCSLP